MKTVGVLDIQGSVEEHFAALQRVDCHPLLVQYPQQLKECDSLILPGGESSAIMKIINHYDFTPALKEFAASGKKMWGTCAGLIILSQNVDTNLYQPLGLLDVDIIRNGYGRQLSSFRAFQTVKEISPQPFEMVFIRAPIISRWGKDVEVLAEEGGKAVVVRQNNIVGTTFHPELTQNGAFHRYMAT